VRIAFVTSELYPRPGGLQTFAGNVAGELARHHVVGLIAGPGQRLPPRYRAADLARIRLARPRSSADASSSRARLHATLEAFEPDVVHFASAGLAIYWDAIPASVARAVTLHGNDFAVPWQRVPGVRNVRGLIVEAIDRCDAVMAVSAHTAALARRLGVRSPVSVVRPGCDLLRFTPWLNAQSARRELDVPDGVPVVLTISRVVARKGHLHLLRALERTPVECHWVVVGRGPYLSPLRAAARASRMAERCTFLGVVGDESLPAIYAACDVFAVTPESRDDGDGVDSEGFGMVFHEAGACGKPVLGTATAGVAEAVIDGVTGLLVPPADPDAAAAALTCLLADPALRRRLGTAAREHVVRLGGWSRVARSIAAVYELDTVMQHREHLQTQLPTPGLV
jgi:phosphatidyl-myo-inositol dimannoside synthase